MEKDIKAKELVNKLFNQYTDHMQWNEACEIANAVVEEIIGALYDVGIREPEYWYTVQEEIEKLKNQ